MRVKNNKGSITIFVLVGLLFMTSFLVILYANNVNKSKIAKEQFNIISKIYSPNESDEQSYTDAYTDLRKKNKQTMKKTVENSSTIELDKTYEEELVNYRIYGNSVTNTIEEFTVYPTKEGFLPAQGAYPTTDARFDNPTYEIIEIKKGQTLYFDYTGSDIGYVRIRCIDSNTNEVICDLVDVEGNIAETDYYKATIYYTYTTEQTEGPDGYVTAKKDFKLGIMYLYDKPDDYNMKIYGTETVGVGDYKKLRKGAYVFATGEYNSGWENYVCTTNPIYAKAETEYRISMADSTNGEINGVCFYDKDNTYLGSSKDNPFTTPANISYFHVNIIATNEENIITVEQAGKIKIEEVNETTSNKEFGACELIVKVASENDETSQIANISLKEPLYNGDYLDFKLGKVVRSNGTEENINLPELSTFEDYTKIEVLTIIKPSRIELEYKGYKFEQ